MDEAGSRLHLSDSAGGSTAASGAKEAVPLVANGAAANVSTAKGTLVDMYDSKKRCHEEEFRAFIKFNIKPTYTSTNWGRF